jgi:heterodisulfide reductase subunit C
MTAADALALSQEFVDHIHAIPEGHKIDQCLQCGTCSASCPTSAAMDYGPREILAALRAGLLDRVLDSNTVWLCASCYSCTVRCPAGIPFTDVMYELKRLGVAKGLHLRGGNNAAMARAFTRTVDRNGRNAESELMRRYLLSTRPADLFSFLPLCWRLLRRGRLGLRVRKIKELEGLRKMLATVDGEEKA